MEPEKRQQYRFVIQSPVAFKIIRGKSHGLSTRVTSNLSAFGLCAQVEDMDADDIHMVFNDTPLNRNTLQLEISIPKQQPFSVIGEVRWFERISGEGKYNYNVEIKFLKISEKDIKTIVEFIKDKSEDLSGVSRRG